MWFYITTIILAIFSSVYSAAIDDSPKWWLKLQEKCRNNSQGDEAFNNLQSSIERFTDCLSSTTIDTNVCGLLENGYHCLGMFPGDNLSKCLVQEELYLTNFLAKSANVTSESLCDVNSIDGGLIGDLSTCLKKQLHSKKIQRSCLHRTKTYQNLKTGSILQKDNFCSDVLDFKKCVLSRLDVWCEGDFSELLNVALNPFVHWCSSED